MTDGVFALFQQVVDEHFVLMVVGQCDVHLVNLTDDFMPLFSPLFYCGVLAEVCTFDKGVEQIVGRDEPFDDGFEAHSHIIAIDTAGLVLPGR